MVADISLLGIDFVGIFIQFILLVVSLSVHEAAHAWSADKLGDPTARMLGRVSLNPARARRSDRHDPVSAASRC